MKFFSRLLLSILPLVVVPYFLGVVFTAYWGGEIIRDLVIRNAMLELDFFSIKCREDYMVLQSLGLQNIEYYRDNLKQNLAVYARERHIPGGYLYIKKYEKALEGFVNPDTDYVTYEIPFYSWDWKLGIAVAQSYLSSFSRHMYTYTSILLLCMLPPTAAVAYWISKRISRPLVRLERTARELARGNLHIRAKVPGDVEVGNLARAVNGMAEDLEALTRGLEQRVAERTAELEKALEELRVTQKQLIQSEKRSLLGQLTAGIAHELNTPLGAVLSVADTMDAAFRKNLRDQRSFLDSLSPEQKGAYYRILNTFLDKSSRPDLLIDRALRDRVGKALADIELGDKESLVESVLALQVQDSLPDILPLLKSSEGRDVVRYASATVEPINLCQVVRVSSRKAVRVVERLNSYIQSDENSRQESIDVAKEINTVLVLFRNKMKQGVHLRISYEPDIRILADRQQMNLVWTNIIKNALDAMNYQGELTIETYSRDEMVYVKVSDTGPGIPEEIAGRIFEPFFTTKQAGTGIGLGLDITRKIVEKAGGCVTFNSNPGETCFTLAFPREGSTV